MLYRGTVSTLFGLICKPFDLFSTIPVGSKSHGPGNEVDAAYGSSRIDMYRYPSDPVFEVLQVATRRIRLLIDYPDSDPVRLIFAKCVPHQEIVLSEVADCIFLHHLFRRDRNTHDSVVTTIHLNSQVTRQVTLDLPVIIPNDRLGRSLICRRPGPDWITQNPQHVGAIRFSNRQSTVRRGPPGRGLRISHLSGIER